MYGVMVALGYVLGVLYVRHMNKSAGLTSDQFWNLVTALVLGAVLGGKLLYVLLYWHDFGSGFFDRLAYAAKDFRYGFVFYGGLAGAFLSGAWYCRKIGLKFWFLADFFAPAIALGHAIGRMGCYFAGCCYGRPSPAWAGFSFNHPQCLVPWNLRGVPLYPVQLFEVLGNILLFAVLHWLLKRRADRFKRSGALMLGYFGGYAILRFFVEFFRGDDRGGFAAGLSPSQIAALAAVCFIFAAYRFLPARKG